MAKDPAFLFYPGDYMAGTMHLDFECKGAYIDLLMLQFNRHHMTQHMIRQVLQHRYDHIWQHIRDKFVEKDGFFWNERLRLEKEKRATYCKSRKENKSKDKHKSPHMTDHMLKHMEDENINENIVLDINISFEDFWVLYDKKVGEKNRLQKKWESMNDGERVRVMEHIPKYKIATPDKKFRKDPGTYLNNKSWNDEIINNGTHRPVLAARKDAGALFLLDSLKADLGRVNQ